MGSGLARVSSVVVAPALMTPSSTSSLGMVVASSSSMPVCAAGLVVTSVGVLPPSGPTETGSTSRVPSLAEITTGMPIFTIFARVAWTVASSSMKRPGKPVCSSVPKPRLAVITEGRGFWLAAASRAAEMPAGSGSCGTTRR